MDALSIATVAADDVPWLSEDPISGTVPAGDSLPVDVILDATGLPLGDYTADLVIYSNDPDENSVTVPVVMHVSTGNNPPNTPSNPSPADGATDQDINVDLSWTGGDPDPGDTVTYTVYFEASDPPADPICVDVPTTTCDPGPLACDTDYYWRVVATDTYGASTAGDTWVFTTIWPLGYYTHTVDDDDSGSSSGDGHGDVNPGETIELYITLQNEGSGNATGVNATLSTSSSYATLTIPSSSYPDIPGGGTGTNTSPFVFEVDPHTPNGQDILFDPNITASNGGPWSDSFEIKVEPPQSTPQFYIYLPIVLKRFCDHISCDPYECNDNRNDAWGPLASGQIINDARICQNDPRDVYYFTASGSVQVTIDLTNIPDNANFDLYLWDETGSTPVAKSEKGTGQNEQIKNYTLPRAGYYYVDVYPRSGTGSYTLQGSGW
jgi:hypothetical protein